MTTNSAETINRRISLNESYSSFPYYYRKYINNRLIKYAQEQAVGSFTLAGIETLSHDILPVFKENINILVLSQEKRLIEMYLKEFKEAKKILAKDQNEKVVSFIKRQFKAIQKKAVHELEENYGLTRTYALPVTKKEALSKNEFIENEEFSFEDCFAESMALEENHEQKIQCQDERSSPYEIFIEQIKSFKL